MRIKIYVEGGGDTKALRSLCQRGFNKFFQKIGLQGRMPKVIACGSREQVYRQYRIGLTKAPTDQFTLLLVDSEAPVDTHHTPWQHLQDSESWNKPEGAADESAQLMVQVMESWFLADKDAMVEYYGQGFIENVLPANKDIEDIPKSDVLSGLSAATKQSRKGSYSKGSHSFDILAKIDPFKVIAASPYAKKLIDTLKQKAVA